MEKHVHGGNIYAYEGCMDFSANLNPLGLPERVKEAVVDSLKDASLYPEVGYAPLKQAIAEYENIPEEYVICGNGAAEIIYTLCRALKPRKALMPAPTFAEYALALDSIGAQIEYYPLSEKKDFILDEDFLDSINETLDIIFLCNPNNPTGLLIPKEILLKILKKCKQNQVFLIVDECFLDFVKEPEKYSLVQELDEYKNLFLLKAFTKRYAMAGIRLGYGLCGNQNVLGEMHRMVQPWNISVMAEAAGIAALKEKDYVEEGRRIVFEESEYLKEELKKLSLVVWDSTANYIFFKGQEDLFEKAIEKGILIRDCSNYQGLTKGYYRIAVKTHQENEMLIMKLNELTKFE